jgi:WD40 repeat protein
MVKTFGAGSMRRLLSAISLLFLLVPVTSGSSQADTSQITVTPQLGLSMPAFAVAFSPDGQTIISADYSSTLKLWDAASGRELRTLTGQDYPIRVAAFSPDGRTTIVGANLKLRLLDLVSGRELGTMEGLVGGVSAIAFSPDGRTIAAASVDKTLKLWDAASGRELQTFKGHDAYVNVVTFSPDGRTIVMGSADKTLTMLDVSTGRELHLLAGHADEISAVAFAPDGGTIVSGSRDKTLKLWDAVSGRELRTLPGHGDRISGVAFSPDGRTIVSGSADKTLKLWDTVSGRELRTIQVQGGVVYAVAFSPDGRMIVSGSHDRTLKLWDTSSGRELRTLAGRGDIVRGVAFSPDGRTIVSAGDGLLTLWDAANGRERQRLTGHGSGVHAVAFSPDGRTIVSGGYDKALKLWDAASGRELLTLAGHGAAVNAVAFSPDGRKIVSGSDDKTLKLWDAASGRELLTLAGHGGAVNAVAFSPDGRKIVSGSDDETLKLWDAPSGRELRTFAGPHGIVESVVFSPDGKTIVSGSAGLDLWDAARKRALRTLEGHHRGVSAVAFSAAGRTIVSGSWDDTLKLWDVASGHELRTLVGHSGWVTSVAVSQDERRLSSGSRDGTLRLWSGSGEPLTASFASKDGEWVTITPEGFFDASTNGAKMLNVVRGLEAYSVDQFYNQLYRPDLVREKLAGDPNGKVKEAAAKLDLTKALAGGSAPRVGIAIPSPGTEVRGEQTTVEAEISDQGGGVGKVEWRVNDITLGVEERGVKRVTDQGGSPDRARSIKVSRTLGLTPGENKIAVLAYNEAGLIASAAAEITVNSVQQTTTKPRLYVLAVGINDYWDGALRLSYAAPDAKTLSDGLKQAGSKLYERVEVRTVLDGEATAEKLDGVFTELGKRVRPQDVFVFFLAGHGKTVDARFYFLPQDFRYAGEDSIPKKGVGQNQLQDWFSRIKAQKSVLLFDACESGSLVGDKFAMRGIEEKTAVDRMTRAMGRTVLTATTDSKPAIEGYRGHGVFTYALLAGLNAADTNGDGVIDVTELAQYVDQQLPELTFDAFRLRQVPQMSIVGSNFPLATRVTLLSAGPPAFATDVPAKPTHVVIAPADLYETAAETGRKLGQLPRGAAVSLIKTAEGWVLIARDGKILGYVAQDRLLRIQ